MSFYVKKLEKNTKFKKMKNTNKKQVGELENMYSKNQQSQKLLPWKH